MANTFKFGNGEWARKTGRVLAYNSENDNYKPLPFTFDRASSATRVNKEGLIETVDVDEPRIDFLNNSKGHLLLEPQATNLITNSESYSSWNKDVSVSVTSTDNTSPTNESNASKITVTDSGRLYYDPTISTTADRVTSVFLKGGSFVNFKLVCVASSQIDLSTETASNGFGIEKLNDGWFRISTTAQSVTPTSRRIQIQAYPDNTYTNGHGQTGTYFVFGTQMEDTQLTSYIPTSGSAVTRSAETCNNAGNSTVFNSEEGTLYAEIAALANDGTNRTIALNKDTNDRIQMYFNTSDNGLSIFYKAQGTHTFIMNETLSDATEFNKIAFKWKTNDFALWVNGTETDTVSSGITSNADTLNALEFEMFNDSSPFYGKAKDIRVYNTALTDAELIALTS